MFPLGKYGVVKNAIRKIALKYHKVMFFLFEAYILVTNSDKKRSFRVLKFLQPSFMALAIALCPFVVSAQTLSPAMIEQFKKLPRAEQERLAKQYGIDPASLSASKKNDAAIVEQEEPLKPKHPVEETPESLKDKKKQEHKLPRFGLELFNSKIATFAPTGIIPVPDSYLLGPDDTLLLQMFGKKTGEYQLTVSRDGDIFIPEVGSITVAGLSFKEVQQLVKSKVSQSLLGVETTLSMGKLRTINIFIAGEAKHPGSYTVSALTSVSQALFIAGGVSEIGSLRNIIVKRNGKNVAKFDVYDLLLRGDARNDIQVQNSDVIFIEPVQAIAEVKGEVLRPMLYEVSSTDTLATLLSMAGGVKSTGYPQAAVLERFSNNSLRKLQNVNLTDDADKNILVSNGDILRVGITSPRIQNQIIVAGAVIRPGKFAWYPGLKVNDLIGSIWSDLYPTTDLDYALVLRQVNKQGDIKVLQFNLGNAISDISSDDNISLASGDILLVVHYGNQTADRAILNQALKDSLTSQFETPEFERWLSDEKLAEDAFQLISTDNNQAGLNTVAGLRIQDNVMRTKVVRTSNAAPLSYEAMLAEQKDALQAQMQRYLDSVFTDEKILELSAHFSRQELMYSVVEKLKRQARHGEQPKIVSISGETVLQGEFPLAENAKIVDLIVAASGLKDSAFVSRAELTRLAVNDNSSSAAVVNHISVDIKQAIQGDETSNIALESRDRLNVFAIPDWNIDRLVEIRGEVRFPGRYAIQKGENLSSVIKRAGGLMEGAFVSGAVFTREKVRERERLQINKLIEQLTADVASRALSAEKTLNSPQDSIAMVNQLKTVQPVGRLVIDLEQIIEEKASADLAAEHGDVLFIPRFNSAITIVGEVQNASSHRFKPQQTLDQYLTQAGGLRKRADENRIYVIRADGSVMLPQQNRWFAINDNQLQPGDTIVVPLDTEYTDSMTLWTQVTQIFYQSAVALAALNSF